MVGHRGEPGNRKIWTQTAARDALPLVLAERGLTLRTLAREVGVSSSHLSRALRGTDSKSLSGELAGNIAMALGLPRDYFPDYREAVAVRAVRDDPALRDRLYRRVCP